MPTVVNGREFSGLPSINPPANENWDGFDDHNRFLAQLRCSTSSISTADMIRGSFFPSTLTLTASATSSTVSLVTASTDLDNDLITDAADNDGDGVIDGIFQDVGLPDATDSVGNAVNLRASILVVDLDGRFNVNAHDGLMKTIYTGTVFAGSGTNPNWSSTLPIERVPLGTGYGPAEVNSAHLFITPLNPDGTFANGEQPRLFPIAGGRPDRSTGQRLPGSRYTQDLPTPRLGAMEGRYGEAAPARWTNLPPSNAGISTMQIGIDFARPGIPGTDDEVSGIVDRRVPYPPQSATANYGVPAVWWTGSANFNWGLTSGGYPQPRGVFNSPPDLHGRMKTLTLSASNSALVPCLAFAQPEWSTVSAQNEARDDPYETLLDTRTARGGMLFDPSSAGTAATPSSVARDNPFTPGELESVLRPYDADANKLPPRLVAMLGSAAEESRLKITTDSWDTTAMTGSAAIILFGAQGGNAGWLQRNAFNTLTISGSTPLSGVIGGEVARGERFDLNRSLLASGTDTGLYSIANPYYRQRQAYFKDLYTLLYALDRGSGGATPAAEIAQWVANVVEFRDADSVMTPFEYDSDPSDGWTVNGDVTDDSGEADRAVVFGVERPEILIQETLAWERVDPTTTGTTGGMCITLHRPWNAIAAGSGTSEIAGEPCDYAFDTLLSGSSGRATNVVDLGKKSHDRIMSDTNSMYDDLTNATYPIWRLRIESSGGTQYVRFDTDTAGTNELLVSGTGTPGTAIQSGGAKPKLPVDTSYTFFSGTTARVGPGSVSITLSGSFRQALSASGFRVAGGPTTVTTGTRSATVFLERLSNPGTPASAAEWAATPLAANSASGTSPQQYVVVDSATMSIVNTGTQITPSLQLASTRRDVSSGTTAPWRAAVTVETVASSYPTITSSTSTAWMPWPNRPYVSSAELMLVPRGHAMGMLHNYQQLTPATAVDATLAIGIPVSSDLLFDAVHVPTRFAGIHQTYALDLSAETGIFSTGVNTVTTVNQLSSFREPGRVNLNTIPSADVWNAVVAGPLEGPVQSGTGAGLGLLGTTSNPARPAKSMFEILCLSGSSSIIISDTTTVISGTRQPQDRAVLAYDQNPLHTIYTATRLANTATPRSNVFGVWITLRQSIPNDPDSVRYHRAFYIVDRSVPVAFEEGQDHNVWDCVRLRRIIE